MKEKKYQWYLQFVEPILDRQRTIAVPFPENELRVIDHLAKKLGVSRSRLFSIIIRNTLLRTAFIFDETESEIKGLKVKGYELSFERQ